MKYPLIVRYVAETVWAMQPSKMAELLSVLAFRAAGHEFTKEEIQARIGDGNASSGASKRGAVAVIPVHGVIAHRMSGMEDSSGGTSCERLSQMIAAVAADPGIGTILYDFNTPGGSVTGMAEVAAQMWALRGVKTQIAQVNGLAASAGYCLASQCDEIISMPSGITGSIGVFSVHEDLSQALEQEGISLTTFSAGKYKLEGSPFGPLTEEAKAFMQARVDTAYAQFVKDVARGRGVSVADVRNGFGEGRALNAKDALKAGLITSIGTMDATIGRLVGKSSGGLKAVWKEEDEPFAGRFEKDTQDALAEIAGLADSHESENDRARRSRLL